MRKIARNLTLFRHGSHAEWGYGIIVDENPGKIYLQFENGGRRAFVNTPQYREQLVAAELSSEDAAALFSKLEKYRPVAAKVARKRVPSRSVEK